MPTLRLEFDLDSDVYPELHAALASLRSSRSRGERLRQLAAAGLVWEKVRLHGAGATPLAMEAQPAPAPAADAGVPAPPPDADPPPQAMPEVERRASAPRRSRAGNAEKRRSTDFVDLAINAEPTPVPPASTARRSARPSRHELEQVIRELPVLMDVVADVSPLPEPHAEPMRALDVDDAATWADMNSYPDDVEPPSLRDELDAGDDDSLDSQSPVLHVTALSHKPATRSRLMRMKERGLFKNG